ncbi:ATP-dependent DNA helicase Snf21 [Massospora cicadina]|nr:ATP-dependent DNA helicase Snf21 [Massospora cicadina]
MRQCWSKRSIRFHRNCMGFQNPTLQQQLHLKAQLQASLPNTFPGQALQQQLQQQHIQQQQHQLPGILSPFQNLQFQQQQLQYQANLAFPNQPSNPTQHPFLNAAGMEAIRPGGVATTNLSPNVRNLDAPKANLTQDQLRKLFQRLAELKKEGASASNNQEYNMLLGFLKECSQLRSLAQAQGGPRPLVPMPGPTPILPQATAEGALPKADTQFSLNASHLQELSRQITEFKYLSKNLPVPSSAAEASPISIKQDANPVAQTLHVFETLRETDPIPTKIAVDTILAVRREEPNLRGDAARAGSPEPTEVLGYLSPFKVLEDSQARLQRVIVPSVTPQGLDPYAIALEREERLKARIQQRIKELEALPSNLSNGPLSEDLPHDGKPHSAKLKAVIELKALKLLGFQKKLREEILRGASRSSALAATVDRNNFRRTKRQTLREARHTERLEKQQRVEREKRERQKHAEFLAGIIQHGKDLLAWHKNQQAKQSRIGKLVLQFHSQVDKEEQRRVERLQKQRLELLRTGNEQEYLKLIDQAKDTRISLLLKQTDGFLKSLTKSVIEQQNDHSYYDGSQDRSAMQADTSLQTSDANDADYYSIAHRIKEEITRQPSLLVGGTLKDYQLRGLQWMVSLYNNRLNGILADEMGLGKTIQTISLISYLIEVKHLNGPFLVLVPLSTIPNWAQEFNKWAPSITKVVYKGSPAERKELQRTHLKHNSFQVLLTTFEYIIRDKSVLSKIPWMHMIIDEGHRMKNSDSKLSLTLNGYYTFKYRLILTGTPLQNNLPELWSLLNFVLPRIFNSVTTFDEWFNTPFSSAGGQDRIELNEEEQLLIIKRLHKVLRPFLLRRLKKDVESELPDKVEKVVKCKMSALQLKVYHRIQRHVALLAPTTGKVKSKGRGHSLSNTIMQLRKVCNHPFVFPEVERAVNPSYGLATDALFRVSGKFELLDRILPKFFQTGHRVLIFFQMTSIMSIFEDYLAYRQVKYLRLDGTTKQEDRAKQLAEFNNLDSEIKLFMLSTRAGGLGLNLQTADTVIIFDSDWNPHQDLQAQDRAHRIGQKKKVLILRLITTNSVEEKILERAQFKLDIDGKVIQAGKFDNKSTAEEREALLRSLLEGDNGDSAGAEEELDDEDMNEMIARSEEERTIFDEMDRAREASSSGVDRLMQEHELPPSLLVEPTLGDDPDDDPANFGRGRRLKDTVIYDDGLTEEQYLQAVENEEDVEELSKRKRLQRQRREERRHPRDAPDLVDEPAQAPPRKRGRKPADPSARSRRAKPEDTLPLHVRHSLNQRMLKCVIAMEELRDPRVPARRICYLFERLPSRRDYPDYYNIIKSPVSIKNLRQRIKDCKYQAARELYSDCMLMFSNARTYNEETSEVYSDAGLLEEAFLAAFEENFPSEEGHIRALKPLSPDGSDADVRDKLSDQSSPASSSSLSQPDARPHAELDDDYS